MTESNQMPSLPGADERGARFMRLYMANQRRLFGFVMSMVPDVSAVDDIVQETVAYMWKQFDQYQHGSDFTAWAFAVARHRIFDYLKHKKRQGRTFSLDTMDALDTLARDQAPRHDNRLEALQQCLATLKRNDRELIQMRYEVGSSLKSIAGRIDLSVNTLYSRLYKIRIALVQCIRKKMAGENL